MRINILLLGGSVLGLAANAHAAHADTAPAGATTPPTAAVQEVIVTAEKREESVQQLPVAISVYSGEALTNLQVNDVSDLQHLAPSVEIHGTSAEPSINIQIRGIGSFSGEEPAVAQVQDGVPYTTVGWGNLGGLGTVSMFDVNQVEVLRGPQGTLGGRNATAGGIYVTSRPPTDTWQGYIEGSYGNYNDVDLEGAVGGPIIDDKLMMRIALRSNTSDGWITNTYLNQKLYGIDQQDGRFSLLARPTDNFQALLILAGDLNGDRPVGVATGRARPDQPSIYQIEGVPTFDYANDTIEMDQDTYTRQRRGQAILHLDWTFGRSKLTSISGYVDRTVVDDYDDDGSLVPTQLVGPRPFHSWASQWSQELTFTSSLGSRLDFILGAIYVGNHRWTDAELGFPFLGLPAGSLKINDYKNLSSYSGYGELRYRLPYHLRITAGVRYTDDSKWGGGAEDLFDGLAHVSTYNHGDWGAFMPRFVLDWEPSSDLTWYASAAKGFKSGGIEMATFPATTYKPEYVWNYETGAKVIGLDGRVSGTAALFYMDYTDLQQTVAGLVPGQIAFETINASKAAIKGVELTLDGTITKALHVSVTGSYLDAHYEGLSSFDPLYPELGTPGPAGLNIRDLSGNPLAGAPTWQYDVNADYTTPLTDRYAAVTRASWSWQSKAAGDIYNHIGLQYPSYGLLNLSETFQTFDDHWELTIFSTNTLNKLYPLGRGGSNGYTITYATSVTVFGDPLRYGIRLERKF